MFGRLRQKPLLSCFLSCESAALIVLQCLHATQIGLGVFSLSLFFFWEGEGWEDSVTMVHCVEFPNNRRDVMLGEKTKSRRKKGKKACRSESLDWKQTPRGTGANGVGQRPVRSFTPKSEHSCSIWNTLVFLTSYFSKYDVFMYMYHMRSKSKPKIHSCRRQLTHIA